jgi:Zn-dependent M28 family amino/carboxypeptidase
MLINDPPLPNPQDPSKLDDAMFKGRAMTYYGRWTYKYEIAMQKGAAAAIIVHETEPAAYPWMVVVGSNFMEKFALQTPDKDMSRVAVEGWVTLEKARELCANGGQDFAALKKAALRRDFKPVPLGVRMNFSVTNTLRSVASQNVAALLPGSDRKLRSEYVIYTAHWDHLGRNRKLEGDQIYNGAVDNASGTAALLEMARAFTRLKPAPKRSVLFLSVTAEEKGLLGAQHYAREPLYPLTRTLANINVDVINVLGRTRDVSVIGFGQNTLEDILRTAAVRQDRTLVPDPQPEKGGYYRSDHFEFAKVGVPALYAKSGVNYIGRPEGWGIAKSEEYTARDYHKPSDEMKPDWEYSGAVEDLQLLVEVGSVIAQSKEWPQWKSGSEFKARRETMLKRK